MSRSRTTRLLTVSVVTTLVAGLLALIGVGLGPAQANHGSRSLQASPEIAGGAVGQPITIVVTLSAAAAAGSPIQIDAEIENTDGSSEGSSDPNGADAPDAGCTVAAEQTSCGFSVTSSVPTTKNVRVWIDHDGKNAVGENGVTEADMSEERLANADPDTVPAAGTTVPPHADCRQPEDFPAGRLDQFQSGCGDDEAGAGARGDSVLAGADDTDVVEVTWNTAPSRIDCDWENSSDTVVITPITDAATVTCRVLDTSGNGAVGVYIDAENLSSVDGEANGNGANDPDDGSTEPADYGDGVDDLDQKIADEDSCRTGSGGVCTFDIEPVRAESGPAIICFWIDKQDDADDEDDYDLAGAPSDGGDCDTEVVGETESNDATDALRVRWANAPATATTLDLTPETGSANTGGTQIINAHVLDQFGDPFTGGEVTVNFELTDPSPSDTDGNTPASEDDSCKTNASTGVCGISLSSNAAGTDTVCGWFGSDPAMTSFNCGGETASDSGDVARIDVVTRTWTVQTTGGGGGTGGGTGTGTTSNQGYVLVGGDGGIFNYGTATFHGSTGNLKLNQPIIGIAYMPGGDGYWLVAKDGGVFTFGAAKFHGSMGDKTLNAPVLGMESTPSGNGYWLYAADGGIFTFGDAQFKGSTGDKKLNAPMIGMAVTEKGDGYWLVAQDGGVFTFNAPFFGSTGDKQLNQPVFDMAPASGDKGYWLVARDGGVFTFGNIDFYGSAANVPGRGTVIGMGDTPTGNGYWIADVNGKVMPFGDAKFIGDRSTSVNNAPMVAFATVQPKAA